MNDDFKGGRTMEKNVNYKGPRRAAYELWLMGVDLREIYSRATYTRHKRFFLDHHQINIDVPPSA